MKLTNLIEEAAEAELREAYIAEAFINLHTKSDMKKYGDVVYNLLQRTYKDIGGFAGAKDANHMISKAGFMKLVRKNGKIVAAKIYKDKHGRKAFGAGHDGTTTGKTWVKQIYKDDITFNRSWGEFSGAAEKYMLYKGMVPVPASKVSKIIGNPSAEGLTGFHYTRQIGGKDYEKILLAPKDSKLHN